MKCQRLVWTLFDHQHNASTGQHTFSTIDFRYNAVRYYTILLTARQQRQ